MYYTNVIEIAIIKHTVVTIVDNIICCLTFSRGQCSVLAVYEYMYINILHFIF